jgi:hypothetical protein
VLLSRLPLRIATALDLHVLGLPPAFALSQDQTLKLDENFFPADHTFDEVPTRRSLARTDDVENLETLDRRSLFQNRFIPEKAEAFPFARAVRKDSAVHVSLSSDLLFKHPGNLAAPSPSPAGAGAVKTPNIRRGDANIATASWPDARSPCEQ